MLARLAALLRKQQVVAVVEAAIVELHLELFVVGVDQIFLEAALARFHRFHIGAVVGLGAGIVVAHGASFHH